MSLGSPSGDAQKADASAKSGALRRGLSWRHKLERQRQTSGRQKAARPEMSTLTPQRREARSHRQIRGDRASQRGSRAARARQTETDFHEVVACGFLGCRRSVFKTDLPLDNYRQK